MKLFNKGLIPKSHSWIIGVILVFSATAIWSTVPVGTKLLMNGGGAFSPAFLSSGRLIIAAVIFLFIRAIYAKKSGEPFAVPINRYDWLIITAVALCINYIFYAIGLRYTTAGATSIVSQVNSVATVLLSAALLGERITKQKVVGMLLAISGVLLVLLSGDSVKDLLSSSHFKGNIIEITGALAWPFYAIGQTKLLQNGGSRQILMPIFVVAAIISLFLLPFTGPLINYSPTLRDWGVLLFLGVGSTAAAYALYATGLRYIETSVATMFNVLMPPFAIVLASWLLHETIHANVLAGLGLVILGLILIVWHRHYSPLRVDGTHRK